MQKCYIQLRYYKLTIVKIRGDALNLDQYGRNMIQKNHIGILDQD